MMNSPEDGMDAELDADQSVEEMVEEITDFSNDTAGNPKKSIIEEAREDEDKSSKIPRNWDPVELDFLLNNRTSLGNKELEDFLREDSELHEKMEKLSDFRDTEKRFLMDHYQALSIEEMADRLDRDEEVVELKLEIMGLKEV